MQSVSNRQKGELHDRSKLRHRDPQRFPETFPRLRKFRRRVRNLHRGDSQSCPIGTILNHEWMSRMDALGVISKVDKPTLFCAGMVVVPKKNTSTVRMCVDLKPLNQSLLSELHPLPKVDETLSQLSGETVFSKLDANSGFWQIPLEKESRLLAIFITPSGRYCFNKLPFGISSASELFQKRMSNILHGFGNMYHSSI